MKRAAANAPLTCSLLALLMAASTLADERSFSWIELAAAGQLSAGRLATDPSEGRVLELSVPLGEAVTLPLLTVRDPAIVGDRFSIRGRVRYQDVTGIGYLEMFSVFAGEQQYFSRTLAERGAMGNLNGSADWREFQLPFRMVGGEQRPVRLQLNLFLPAGGTVYLSNLRLHDSAASGGGGGAAGAWWARPTGNRVGGLVGAALGVLGALLGVLSTKPRFFSLVISAGRLAMLLSLILAIGCGIAWMQGQPFYVIHPLGLIAVILGPISVFTVIELKRRRTRHELRTLRGSDLS